MKNFKLMRNLTIAQIVAAQIMSLVLVGCSSSNETVENTESSQTSENTESVGISNPWVECDTVEDAENQLNFQITIPTEEDLKNSNIQALENYSISQVRVLESSRMIEINYSDQSSSQDENNESIITIRKSVGANDSSGVYTVFKIEELAETPDFDVRYLGNDEDSMNLAIWQSGEYSYSVYSENGLQKQAIEYLVQKIN